MDTAECNTQSTLVTVRPYGIIYKVTNTVNGKVYVGQTTQTMKERWGQHVRETKIGSQYIFHRAIRKYGAEAFHVEVLCECVSLEEMNRKERKYAWLHNAMSPHGYTLKAGNGKGAASQELRESISRGLKGRSSYERAVSASVAKRTGVPLTETHKAKISAGNKGQRKGERLPEATMQAAWAPASRRKIADKLAGIFFFLSPYGEQTLVINLSRFCREHHLPQAGMQSVSSGRGHLCKGWRRDPNMGMPSFPGVPPVPEMILPTKPLKDHYFISPDGHNLVVQRIEQFCALHNLSKYCMRQVSQGKRAQHEGWRGRTP